MKMKNIIPVFLAVFWFTSPGTAQDMTVTKAQPKEIAIDESKTLEIVGFGDFITTIQEENNGNMFDIGQAEVDLESNLTDAIEFALAIAYDNGVFGIGAFTVDWTVWQLNESALSSFAGITDLTIGGGQFDVPFGIDWHVYPSIDRKLVSTPLIVENTHACWNDYGGYMSVEAVWGNATVFGANGFCYEGENLAGDEIETQNQFALGGRAGVTPVASLEVGTSFSSIHSRDESYHMQLVGADFQFSVASLDLKGEYIAHRFSSGDNEDFTNDGYYVQGLYGIRDWYIVSRYGEFRPDRKSADTVRFSGGIVRSINNVAELCLEYQANKDSENAAIFQVSVRF